MSERSALALLSGGLDSTVACFLYKKNASIRVALTLDYGQRALKKEIQAAQLMCQILGAEHQVFELPFLKENLQGALQDTQVALPHLQKNELDDMEVTRHSAQAVWVPNRNGLMIEAAACVAEAKSISEVIVGFNREEAATFPDNSADYLNAINQSLKFSTQGKVQVVSPTLHLNKVEIVRAGLECGVPLENLWSCYEGGETPCGLCESCMRFERAMSVLES